VASGAHISALGSRRSGRSNARPADTDAYALALVENIQRVDLSHMEKVATLDQLGELAQEGGLRRTARRLHMSPGWLSVQLSLRKDPVIYPALETGRVSFGQAAALLRAPTHARQSLLEQTLRKRAGIGDIQAWVREVRRQDRTGLVDSTVRSRPGGALEILGGILEQLKGLGPPTAEEQRAALRAISERVAQLLAPQTRTRGGARRKPARSARAGTVRRQ
jgi:hypothetical protein